MDDDTTAPPGSRREWVTALGQVSGLLLTVRETEADGASPPDPVAGGWALRAWSAATRPILRERDRVTLPDVRPEDLAVLAATAHVLGASLARWRAGRGGDLLTAVLRCEAAMHGRDPEWLVAQLARVHGVLSAPGPVSAGLVWRALDDGGSAPVWEPETAGS
ncbi:hypothetical protein Acsp06_32290 [Actinomycetospora sp. NBRC 106375]|uniref:hypothetical protein n=1 Tax=Actinomycetospora sp. NBRC 106375 TaxID=3032207 RepID=UPI0024A46A31|nr:hypothetical protein [Actinomycetospora sp. NBRC 106375]GLZ47044.1 hypothetical protein Acsp06_32290 [Actinomycetospora sp. NBRC 106375]